MRVLAQLLVAAGVAVAVGGCVSDPERNPCDAANRTTDELNDAVADFQLTVPAEATEVDFATSEDWTAYLKSGLAAGQPKRGLADGFTHSATAVL